jgi:MYXO-CTERM domain-containing protein
MTRILVVLLAAFLLLAPAAMAKGPHVILTTPKEAVQAGKPWEATLEFNELRHVRNPVLTGTNRGRTVTAKLRPVTASMDDATGFKARTVFPADGRWAIAVTLNGRRFKFPAINVGSSEIVLSYVAFAEGSMADRQGGSGVYMAEDTSDTGPGTALSPEVITYDDVHPGEGGDGGGPEPWLFALGGVVLAGAGVMTVRRRR